MLGCEAESTHSECKQCMEIVHILAEGRNDITTLAFYGHGSETILFFSMGHRKVIHMVL